METNINKPQLASVDAEPGLTPVELPRRVPVYDHFPIQASDEPAVFVNLPETVPAESSGFIVFGHAFEPSYYDGNIMIVNNTIPPKAGDEVIRHATCIECGASDISLVTK